MSVVGQEFFEARGQLRQDQQTLERRADHAAVDGVDRGQHQGHEHVQHEQNLVHAPSSKSCLLV